MVNDIVESWLGAKKGISIRPFPRLGGMEVRPRYALYEHDIDALVFEIKRLRDEVKRLVAALDSYEARYGDAK